VRLNEYPTVRTAVAFTLNSGVRHFLHPAWVHWYNTARLMHRLG
jgi:hypothetical protein